MCLGLKSDVLRRGGPSTHTAPCAPVGVRVLACWRTCLGVCVCLSPCSEGVGTLLSQSSLAWTLRVGTMWYCGCSASLGCGGVCGRWLAFCVPSYSLAFLLICAVLAFSRAFFLHSLVSVATLSYSLSELSPSVHSVVRGYSCSCSSFTLSLVQSLLDSRSSSPRSFLSLFIVTI